MSLFTSFAMTQVTIIKRLTAACYDTLLLCAVLFIASLVALPSIGEGKLAPGNILLSLYYLFVIYLFFAWFWTHGGQTLGMRAWKMKLVSFDEQPINWKQASVRFLTALPAWAILWLGVLLQVLSKRPQLPEWMGAIPAWLIILIGLIWLVFDNRQHTWRDNLSKSKIIIADKKSVT